MAIIIMQRESCMNLDMSVDGSIMQRRVVVKSQSIRVGTGTQKFTCHTQTTVITGFMQRCPA